jgi:hypothetical protein
MDVGEMVCSGAHLPGGKDLTYWEQTGTMYGYKHPSGDVLAFTEYPLGEHSVIEVRPCGYQTFPPPRDRGGVWVDPCSGLAVNLYYLHVSCSGRDKDLF